MTILTTIALVAAFQGGWTWALYEGDGPLVLAHEIPDTPQLKAVLECVPGAGVARLDLFGPASGGMATLRSGSASATGEARVVGDLQSVALRADHPLFAEFVLTGTLDVAVAGRHQAVEVPPEHLAKLRRFAELCGG